MLAFPNAKINLGLNVISKRPDGYHNLETVFYPVPLADALEITRLPQDGKHDTELHQWGNYIVEGTDEKNLALRAYRLLQEEYGLGPVRIDLLKCIPQEAGLGGGSADAAFALKLTSKLFGLDLPDTVLEQLASRLGADCAFFIRNYPVYAEGTGNLFTETDLSLAGYGLVIAKPKESVSTRQAFSHIRPRRPDIPLKDILRLPPEKWRDKLKNDFEDSVFPQCPPIRLIKERLYESGAVYASMSGSGSAVYGLFPPGKPVPDIAFGKDTFIYKGILPQTTKPK